MLAPQLHAELERSVTRARVLQYQRYFADADRVLILLHNEPDPDAMASGLALRNLLRRTKTTAIIGAVQGVSRPENVRMAHLLDIQVEKVTPEQFASFDRVATVDVQPHYFGGHLPHVDLVVDHHPEQPGYSAVFKDIRADYGSTSTILTEHLRAVDMNVSERVATAMLYAIKSDTLFFARHTNRQDLDAFTYLYPLADAALIRKMEGADITLERLQTVVKGLADSELRGDHFFASLGVVPREDFITYTADFFLQLEETKWTFVTGIVNDTLILSVRNLGYSRNAGEFVRRYFGDIGSAGGHRAMAKAVVPLQAFATRHGARTPRQINAAIAAMADQFMHDTPVAKKDEKTSTALVVSGAPRGLTQRLIHVCDQVVQRLDADRQPDHATRDVGSRQLLVRPAVLGGEHRQARQTLHAAQAGGALEHADPIEEARRRVEAVGQLDGHHPAEASHLPRRDRMIGMVRQARVQDA